MGSDNQGELTGCMPEAPKQYDTCKVVMERNTEDIKAITTVMGDMAENVAEIKVEIKNMKDQIVTLTKETRASNKVKERLAVAENDIQNIKDGSREAKQEDIQTQEIDIKRGELKVKHWHIWLVFTASIAGTVAAILISLLNKG